ncbi:MAG TPA: ZIP family metal transporter [Steroidobacteraceae bacterium]|jgi:ZIP family zinc transporter
MTIFLIACAAFCTTYAGGLFALALHDKLHLVLGFSAGAVVAVALVDLIPEAIDIGSAFHSPATLLGWTMLSFLLYLVLDRIKLLHRAAADGDTGHGAHADESTHTHKAHDSHAGASSHTVSLGAGSFSAHSFLDGIAIGVAFQASAAVGAIVTIAVLAHDFSDGINTVSVVLKNGGSRKQAMRWLLADALAPAAGVCSTLLFSIPQSLLGGLLAVFGGFFLYIGASDLVPESHHAHPKFLTTAMTVLGAVVIFAVTLIAGG